MGTRSIPTAPPKAADTDPRQIVASTITFLTNNREWMNYPPYRQAGLPITTPPLRLE